MKTRATQPLLLSVMMAGFLWLTGCTSELSPPPVTKAASTNLQPPATLNTNLAATNVAATAQAEALAPLQKVAPPRMNLPPGVGEVVDLAQAKVGDAVLLEYIRNSTNAYELTVDEIVYLTDLGLSETVVAAMLRHGNQAREQAAALVAAAPPPAPAPAPPTAEAPAATLAPIAQGEPTPVAAPAPSPAPPAPAPVAQAAATQVVYAQPPPQVTYNYFYDSLAPYGSWVELPSYGWCWQPACAVVDPFWQPYSHRGRWLYSDCGWYWHSDYSWGWAPFHYGRWHRNPGFGWVWMPGSVWGPAWVTWRYTDSYCGWAPLPPEAHWRAGLGITYHNSSVGVSFGFGLGIDCFTFVSYRHLHDPTPWRHHLPRHEITKVYNNSTVINNITINNNTIVNRGIAPERVTAVTRQEVPKVALRDLSASPGARPGPARLDQERKTLAVYRPAVPTNLSAPANRPSPAVGLSSRGRQEVPRVSRPIAGTALARPSAPERASVPARDGGTRSSLDTPLVPRPVGPATVGRAESRLSPTVPSRTEAPVRPFSRTLSEAPRPVATPGSPRTIPPATTSGSAASPRVVTSRETTPAPVHSPLVTTQPAGRPVTTASRPVAAPPSARTIAPVTTAPTTSAAGPSRVVTSRETTPVPVHSPLVSTQPAARPMSTASRPVAAPRSARTIAPATTAPTTSAAGPSRVVTSRQTSPAPGYSPPVSAQPAPRQQTYQPALPARSSAARPAVESFRNEPRKIEAVTPSYAPPPKFSRQSAPAPSYVAPASGPRSFSSAPPASMAPAAAPRPSYSPPPSPAPSYSQPRSSAPAPRAPTGGGSSGAETRRGGRDQR